MIGMDVRSHCPCRYFVEFHINTPRTRIFGGTASACQTESEIRRKRLWRIRKEEHGSRFHRNRVLAARLESVDAM
jgi:hypothetical protein